MKLIHLSSYTSRVKWHSGSLRNGFCEFLVCFLTVLLQIFMRFQLSQGDVPCANKGSLIQEEIIANKSNGNLWDALTDGLLTQSM